MSITDWKDKAGALKREVHALYLACRDARTPWYARVIGVLVVGYALSPIDLIPDPIPVLGYLDDLILVPLGLLLVRSLVPPAVMEDCRRRAALAAGRPVSRIAGGMIIAAWVATAAVVGWWVWGWFRR